MKFPVKLLLIISIVFIASCDNNSPALSNKDADTTLVEEENEITQVQNYFPDLFTYLQSQDSSFVAHKFEGGEMESKDSFPSTKLDHSQFASYLPYLVFNKDSSLAIDFVSANYILSKKNGKTSIEQGGPDTEVALLNYKDKTRKRILFLGSAGTVLDAKWEDNNVILIAGAEEVDNEKIVPSIWRNCMSIQTQLTPTLKTTRNKS
jgi:hypothetical protein